MTSIAIGRGGALPAPGLLALILIVNFGFLKYLKQQQGPGFVICGFFLIFYRYSCWALGCAMALLIVSSQLLRKDRGRREGLLVRGRR